MQDNRVFYTSDTVTPTVHFVTKAGAAFDPDTVTLTATGAGGATLDTFETADFTHEADSGVYSVDFATPETPQTIKFVWRGTLSGMPFVPEPVTIRTQNP